MIDDNKLDTLRDLTKFAPRFLLIRTKGGGKQYLQYNRAQLFIHERLEAQLRERGYVRALVLKGRQQGCSTYVQSRYFKKVITRRGTKAFILTHEADATKNLFEMTKRFYDNLEAGFCPIPDKLSAKELSFSAFDSGYGVGTAGSKGTGRSQTNQLFHGCLAQGSKIFDPMTGGIKNIEEFDLDENVLTHTGKLAPISAISSQNKKCISVVFRTLGQYPLIATPKHKVWTKQGWEELGNLKEGDSIGYPVRSITEEIQSILLPPAAKRKQGGGRQHHYPDSIALDYNFGRIIGLYLAEGHLKLQNKSPNLPSSISFAVHRKETQRTIEWLSYFNDYFKKITVKHRNDSLTTTITIYSNRLSALIYSLCGRTLDKHIPFDWHKMSVDFNRGLLHGYISGDGGSYKNERRVRASSICHAITVSLRDMVASLGYGWGGISYAPTAIRNGRNEKAQYTFSLCGDGALRLAHEIDKPSPYFKHQSTKSIKNYAATTTEISNGYAWLRIRSVENAGMLAVYDFEVEHPDHSYVAIQGAVSNSEVGFWPDAETHAQGALQTVADLPGTEIILESTANGIGNYFHGMWKQAASGASEYQAIFVPWYWQNEYSSSAHGFELSEEEEELMDYHGSDGLTFEHLAWRRKKILQSKDQEAGQELFKQEYPFSATEAFLNPIANIYIPSRLVMKARKTEVVSEAGLIIGVDPAIGDRDRTAIIRRKGRCVYGLTKIANHNTMEICGLLKRLITSENPVKVYVDCIGIGAGIVDRMREMGYDCVEGLNVARTANDKEHYRNRRAELWAECLDWLSQDLPVQLPDDDDLHGEICGVGYKYDSNGRLQIESKDEMRARGMPSPDCADALMHTFAGGFYEAHEALMPLTRPAYDRGKFT